MSLFLLISSVAYNSIIFIGNVLIIYNIVQLTVEIYLTIINSLLNIKIKMKFPYHLFFS